MLSLIGRFIPDSIQMMIYRQFSDWRSKAIVQIASPCCSTFATEKTKSVYIQHWKRDEIQMTYLFIFQGFYKLLGRGHIPKQPIIVKAKYFSKKAEDRIRAAGGVCLLRA